MKKISIFLFLIVTSICKSQDLKCEDFKTGTFYITLKNEEIPLKMKIIRELNFQTEIILNKTDIRSKNIQTTAYELIEWIDECSFRLKFDEAKMTLNENQKYINDNNGVLVQLKEFHGRCCNYTVSLFDGKQIYRSDNTVCKE